jgi:hypothetical protein
MNLGENVERTGGGIVAAASASCRLTELLDAVVENVSDVDVAGGAVHGHCNSSLELPVSRSEAAPLG